MGDNNNNNPGNNITVDRLKYYILLYLNDLETYGDEGEELNAATVLDDFVKYIESISG